MAAPRDYYDILGVSRSATDDEIKSAHRRLAKKLHPDVNKAPDAAKQFGEVQEAFAVLSDPAKRATYDRFGHAGIGAEAAGATAGSARGHQGAAWRNVEAGDFSEVFSEVFGGGVPFGGGFGEGRRGGHGGGRPTSGSDVESSIEVDFMTAALGGVRQISMASGPGDGGEQTFDVRIPPGIDDGGRLRLRGKGRPGRRGGPPGDLLLSVSVHRHPWFRREGLDILLDVPISIVEAALGTSVRVPLLRGSVTLKVPGGTSSGAKLRVRGRGIEDAKGERGDFYAVVAIVAPSALRAEDVEALRRLAPHLPNPRRSVPWAQSVAEEA